MGVENILARRLLCFLQRRLKSNIFPAYFIELTLKIKTALACYLTVFIKKLPRLWPLAISTPVVSNFFVIGLSRHQ